MLRLTVAPSMTRSELAADPLMPLVFTLNVPESKVSVVPFLLRPPVRVSAPPLLRIVPVPAVTEMARSSVAAERLPALLSVVFARANGA